LTPKLAVLLHDLSPGGTERIALRLAGAWLALGREVTILCGAAEGPLTVRVPTGADLVSPREPIRRAPGSRRRLGRWAADECRRHGIGGLFVPGNFHFKVLDFFETGEPPIVVAKLSNALCRLDRAPWAERASLFRMQRRLRRADRVVAMSPALAAEAQRLLGPLPITVIPEPVLDDGQGSATPAGERRGIIAAGRFAPQKDFAKAVECMAAVTSGETLTILGDGEERGPVQAMVTRLGLGERIQLPGRVDCIDSSLRQAKVFLLSSRYEGYPAVLIEALAAGCRVVATACSPAIREIIDDPELGEVVESGAPADLAAAVERQLRLPPPSAEAVERIVAPHRMERVAPRYLTLFDHP